MKHRFGTLVRNLNCPKFLLINVTFLCSPGAAAVDRHSVHGNAQRFKSFTSDDWEVVDW